GSRCGRSRARCRPAYPILAPRSRPSAGLEWVMRLVTSRPNSEPLPAPVRDALAGVSPDVLRELVERVAVPRPRGSAGHTAVPGVPAPDVGDFLGLAANHGATGALDRVLVAAAGHPIPVQGLYLPDVPAEGVWRVSPHLMRSDHAPFWRSGQPAVFWTDTAEF